ncbi:hypothetical protein L873DRAFT_1789868 [Choiromyces venosus 120613-1]|uniref:Uncharacterized protein n=1 Tax=Choiromyces venosus 120613-1 TaxID=1336337 RepID=A0A3N4JLD3_9PEZI|nr:hypothetical protein L873DRAFT_1789868 [Choiromyces venosus 120613-1]
MSSLRAQPKQNRDEEAGNLSEVEMVELGERGDEAGSQSTLSENTSLANLERVKAAEPAGAPEEQKANKGRFRKIIKKLVAGLALPKPPHWMRKNSRKTDSNIDGLRDLNLLALETRTESHDAVDEDLPPAETVPARTPLYIGDIGKRDQVLSESFRRLDAAYELLWACQQITIAHVSHF